MRFRSRRPELAKLLLEDLPRRVLGERAEELDRLGDFVGRDRVVADLPKLLRCDAPALLQHHVGPSRLRRGPGRARRRPPPPSRPRGGRAPPRPRAAIADQERRPVRVVARCGLEQLRDGHGIRSTLPVVFRPSRARWASAASLRGNSNSVRSLSLPSRIQPSTSPARWRSSSRVATWWTRLGRVRNREPFWFRTWGSKVPMGPLDWP